MNENSNKHDIDLNPKANRIPESDIEKYKADVYFLNLLIKDAERIYPPLSAPYECVMHYDSSSNLYSKECVLTNSMLTFGGYKKPKKYPKTLIFLTKPYCYTPEHVDDIFGDIDYLESGEIGKAHIVIWRKNKKGFFINIKLVNNNLIVNQIYAIIDGIKTLVYKHGKGLL